MKKKLKKHLCFLLVSLALLALTLHTPNSGSKSGVEPGLSRRPAANLTLHFWDYGKLNGMAEGEQRQVNWSFSKTHLYVHATWRTGSSFLGELFNQHPDVFYLYEPTWGVWQSLYPGDARSLQGSVRDMLRSLFHCDFSVFRLYSERRNLNTSSIFGWKTNKVVCSQPLCNQYRKHVVQLVDEEVCARCPPRSLEDLEKECKKYPAVVMKDVRMVDLETVVPLIEDPELNLHVLQLFRDPRSVHSSRLRSKQSLVKESIQILRTRRNTDNLKYFFIPKRNLSHVEMYVEKAMELICDNWLKDMRFVKGAPSWVQSRYTFVRYEDLVLHPEKELQRLYQFSHLSSSRVLEDFAFNMTRGKEYTQEKPFLISSRNAKEAISAWRETLTMMQISKVEEHCEQVMSDLGYQRSIVDQS